MAAEKSPSLQEERERDAADALESFARYLAADKPDLFHNFYQAKRLLELADRRFRAGGQESLFDACSQRDKEACWAFQLHPRLNAVLNQRGVEMLPIHNDGFVLQTLENCSDILMGPHDLYSLCLCLWVLQHRCISKIVLDVSVVARYHSAAFWRLLRVHTKRLDAVELRGLVDTPDRFSLQPVLCGAVRLTELILVNFTLTPVVIEQLCGLLDQSKSVTVLALRNVVLDTSADYAPSGGSSESVEPLAGSVFCELSQDQTSASEASSCSEGCDDQESVEMDPGSADQPTSTGPCRKVTRNWAPLFRRIEHYASLSKLEISGSRAAVDSSLSDLARALLSNRTLKHLTLQVCLSKGRPLADWLALTEAIGQNEGLESLSFASSRLSSDEQPAMAALRAALEENATLRKLSVVDCGLSGPNMLLLLGCLERNTTLEELRADASHDEDFLQKLRENDKFNGRVELLHKSPSVDVSRTAFEIEERAGEMNCQFTCSEDLVPICAALYRSREAVTVLSLEGKVPMTEHGARLLSSIILKCRALERVSLLFPSGVVPVDIMLRALASSDTVSSLVVGGGWQLTDRAGQAFAYLLSTNRSVTELSVIQPNRTGFEDLKKHVRLGVQNNGLVTKLRLLYGLDRKESRDYDIMRMLQRNRIVARRLEDVASRVRGAAGSMSGTPNLDVEYYTTHLGLNASNYDYSGLKDELMISTKLRHDIIDLAGRFSEMLGK